MENLRRKRAILKGNLTRFSNHLEAIGQNPDELDLSARLVKFENLLEKYEDVQAEIEALAEARSPQKRKSVGNTRIITMPRSRRHERY